MTIFDFLDKHWGFWFAIFLLMLVGGITKAIVALVALARAFLRSDQ